MSSFFLHLDESVKGNVIAVGGFICAADDLRDVAAAWVAMRESMGIDEDEPLKWNYGEKEDVRVRIEKEGWSNIERRKLMIEVIRGAPITLLADVIYDDRASKRSPLDFYKEALDWVVLRFRNFITDMTPPPAGPHLVVLDQPSPAKPARPDDDPRFRWLVNRETIWYHVYRFAYEVGWRFSRARHERVQSLRGEGFYPSVLISHAKFNPLLEIADAVAGMASDFAHYNLKDGTAQPPVAWQDEQFMKVVRKFRAKWNGDILSYGFALFPNSTPGYDQFTKWVTDMCTDSDYAELRGDE